MANPITREIQITAQNGGQSLLDMLSHRFTYYTRNQWLSEIRDHRILVDGSKADSNTILQTGQTVRFTPLPYSEPEVNTDWSILYEDEQYLFVNKPPLLPCHPGGIYLENTLISFLRPRYPDVRLIHRLDRETSGVVLCAKTARAASKAGIFMQNGLIAKEYEVLVEGYFPEQWDAIGLIAPDGYSAIRKKMAFTVNPAAEGAHYCRTVFTRQRHFTVDGDQLSLLGARLYTGKTHQIRATLHSVGYPVTGDKLYGLDSSLFLRFIDNTLSDADRTLLRMKHQALHCSRVSFNDPDGASYCISARRPDSWII